MVTCLGSLVQSCCREGGTLLTNITGMCGECLQCLGHTGFAPTHSMCAFLVYTAQAPGCSSWELSKVGPGLRALPRSKPLRFRFLGTPQRHRLGWACVLCPSQVQAAQVTRCLASALSPGWGGCASHHLPGPGCLVSWVHHKSVISGVPCVSSGEPISACNPPGSKRSSYSPVVFKRDCSLEIYLELWRKKSIPEHLYFSKNFKIILICIWILKSYFRFLY